MAFHYLLWEWMLGQNAKFQLGISKIVPTKWCANTIKKRNNDKLSQMNLMILLTRDQGRGSWACLPIFQKRKSFLAINY